MRQFNKSHKLDHVCYDVRGPVGEEANRMIEDNIDILKLNIGNPYPFGFNAPNEIIQDIRYNLLESQGYSDSKGIFGARKAIMQYCQLKNIPNVGINDIYTGNGVSELITLSMQGLLDDGDEILVPAPDYPLQTWQAANRFTTFAMNRQTGIRILPIWKVRSPIVQKVLSLSTRTIQPVFSIRKRSSKRLWNLQENTN